MFHSVRARGLWQSDFAIVAGVADLRRENIGKAAGMGIIGR
jgi:hypothetical protein